MSKCYETIGGGRGRGCRGRTRRVHCPAGGRAGGRASEAVSRAASSRCRARQHSSVSIWERVKKKGLKHAPRGPLFHTIVSYLCFIPLWHNLVSYLPARTVPMLHTCVSYIVSYPCFIPCFIPLFHTLFHTPFAGALAGRGVLTHTHMAGATSRHGSAPLPAAGRRGASCPNPSPGQRFRPGRGSDRGKCPGLGRNWGTTWRGASRWSCDPAARGCQITVSARGGVQQPEPAAPAGSSRARPA